MAHAAAACACVRAGAVPVRAAARAWRVVRAVVRSGARVRVAGSAAVQCGDEKAVESSLCVASHVNRYQLTKIIWQYMVQVRAFDERHR